MVLKFTFGLRDRSRRQLEDYVSKERNYNKRETELAISSEKQWDKGNYLGWLTRS